MTCELRACGELGHWTSNQGSIGVIMNERGQKFRVAVRALDDGRYIYQIFTVGGEPRTIRSGNPSYATPEDAERAGYEALTRHTKVGLP